MISDGELERRLKALETKMNSGHSSPGTFRILRVEGGLPGPINWAYAGLHRWEREPDEDLEVFVERAARAAYAEGEMSLNVGGLPRGGEIHEKFATFEDWWATVAPYYAEVPPEEPQSYIHRGPVMSIRGRLG